MRMCIDFRRLNNITKKDKYPIPRSQDCLDQMAGSNYFTELDMLDGYWQVPMRDQDVEKTAIRTPLGSYEFLVMPFGLTNAPGTFQSLMESVLRPLLTKGVMVFVDNVFIYTKTLEEHYEVIEKVFALLEKHNLRLRYDKCFFCKKRIKLLGVILDENGISLDPELA